MILLTPEELAVLDEHHARNMRPRPVPRPLSERESNAGRKPVVTKEQTDKARSLACRGFSTRQIATQVGLSQSTVMRLLRRVG